MGIELEASRGLENFTVVHKFGHDKTSNSTYKPVTANQIWQTKQPAGATALRIKAGGDAADTAAGLGAQEIRIHGIAPDGTSIIEFLITAGALASAPTTQTFIRVIDMRVSKSGIYGDQDNASHVGAITVEAAAGGEDWAVIPLNGFANGQSQIAVYPVAQGFTAFLIAIDMQSEGAKPTDFIFLQRENILDTTAPYSPLRVFREVIGVMGQVHVPFKHPIKFNALTDFGAMAKSQVSGEISVDMEIVLIEGAVI